MNKKTQKKQREFLVSKRIYMFAEGGERLGINPSLIPDVIVLTHHDRKVKIAYRCPKCHHAGITLTYYENQGKVFAMCGPREDALGWHVEGCRLTVGIIEMSFSEWEALVRRYADVLWFMATLLGDFPMYPMMQEKAQ